MKQWAHLGIFPRRLGARITPILSSRRFFSASSSSSTSCLRRCTCAALGGEERMWSNNNNNIVMMMHAGRRWTSTTTMASTGVMREGGNGEEEEEEVPLRSSRDSRSALLRLLHDPQDPYLAVIAELDIPSIVKVMKKGPAAPPVVVVGKGRGVSGENSQGEGKEKLEEENKNNNNVVVVDEKSSVQHVFDGLCAINAVLRMILEDPPCVEEVLVTLDAAYEGFLWIYSHYPLRSLSMEALKSEWVVEEEEEEEGAGSACTSSGSAAGAGEGLQNEGDSKVNSSSSTSSPSASPQDYGEKAGEEKEKSEVEKIVSWNISKEKWESDFVPELKELHEMFHGIGERRRIHIA